MVLVNVLLLFLYSVLCSESNIIFYAKDNVIIGRKLFTVFHKNPYAAFYRIPYAEPPLGKLRFKPPKQCSFQFNKTSHDYSHVTYETCSTSLNEDCLYLSIFAPLSRNVTVRYPVLVWVHEDSSFHGPDFFIDEEVLTVTVSFRTHILGFLNTGDDFAEGNMGAKDIVTALKWVRENIHIFFGDPSKVTVAGSGIGSTIVASLILSMTADDLFSRVLVISGSALSPAEYRSHNFETERKLYNRLSGSRNKFNREIFYEILSNASTLKLVSSSQDLFDSSEIRDNQRLIKPFGCVVEKTKHSFISESPLKVYKSKKVNKDVDVMMGFTSFENLHKLDRLADNRKLLKCLNYNFQYLLPFEGRRDEYNSKRYNRIRNRIMDFYFVNGTIGERSLRRYAKYHSDQVIYPLLRQTLLQSEVSNNNVFVYRFKFRGAFNIGWKSSVPNLNWTGATFGDEICYLFRCKSVNDDYKSAETTAERQFITRLVRLMANFVKYGNPTPAGQDAVLRDLKWEPLRRGQNLKGMNLSKNGKMINLPEEKRVKFWDQLRKEFFSDNIIKDEL